MSGNHGISLYLFAKEPVAGKVKTRLAPKLGHARCAGLAVQMLQQSAVRVDQDWPGKLVLCVTPRVEAPMFLDMTASLNCDIVLQRGADLGERMLNALEDGIQQSGAAVVMGCDVPYIPADILQQAWTVLTSGQNVIGPAEDGGFYLMGLQRLEPALFDNVEWGSDQVLEKVRENAARCEIEFSELPTLRDIDLWDDLVWLAGVESGYRTFTDAADKSSEGIK